MQVCVCVCDGLTKCVGGLLICAEEMMYLSLCLVHRFWQPYCNCQMTYQPVTD